MFLVRSWKIGLDATCKAAKLSQIRQLTQTCRTLIHQIVTTMVISTPSFTIHADTHEA